MTDENRRPAADDAAAGEPQAKAEVPAGDAQTKAEMQAAADEPQTETKVQAADEPQAKAEVPAGDAQTKAEMQAAADEPQTETKVQAADEPQAKAEAPAGDAQATAEPPAEAAPPVKGAARWMPHLLWGHVLLPAATSVMSATIVFVETVGLMAGEMNGFRQMFSPERLLEMGVGGLLSLAAVCLCLWLWKAAVARQRRARVLSAVFACVEGLFFASIFWEGAKFNVWASLVGLSFACTLAFCIWVWASPAARALYVEKSKPRQWPPQTRKTVKRAVRVFTACCLTAAVGLTSVAMVLIWENNRRYHLDVARQEAARAARQAAAEAAAQAKALPPRQPPRFGARPLSFNVGAAPGEPWTNAMALGHMGGTALSFSDGTGAMLDGIDVVQSEMAPDGSAVYITAASKADDNVRWADLYVFYRGGGVECLAKDVGRIKMTLDGRSLYYMAVDPDFEWIVELYHYDTERREAKRVDIRFVDLFLDTYYGGASPALMGSEDGAGYDFALSPNGRYLLYRDGDGTYDNLWLFDRETFQTRLVAGDDGKQLLPVAVSNDAATVVWCNPTRTVFTIRYAKDYWPVFTEVKMGGGGVAETHENMCHTNADGSQVVFSGKGGVWLYKDGALVSRVWVSGVAALITGDYMPELQTVGADFRDENARCMVTDIQDIRSLFYVAGREDSAPYTRRPSWNTWEFLEDFYWLPPGGVPVRMAEGSRSGGGQVSISQNGTVLNLLDGGQLSRIALHDGGESWRRLVDVGVTAFAASADGGATYHLTTTGGRVYGGGYITRALVYTGTDYRQETIEAECPENHVLGELLSTSVWGRGVTYRGFGEDGRQHNYFWLKGRGRVQLDSGEEGKSGSMGPPERMLWEDDLAFFYVTNLYAGDTFQLYYFNGREPVLVYDFT